MTQLQKRSPGSWYAVVLGDPAASQMSGGAGQFPSPDLGHACVCCDAEAVELSHYDPSTGPYVSDPIPIPLCKACQPHVRLDEKHDLYIASAGIGGIGLAIIGLFVHFALVSVGVLLLAAAVGAFIVIRARKRALCASGHYCGLELAGAPGFCSVRTMNHRVAAHLIEHHGPLVHRVK